MMTVTKKTGLSVAVILIIAGVMQTGTLFDPLLLFLTIGLVPGTNLELPPELVLLAVAAALMALTAWLFIAHIDYRIELSKYLSEFKTEEEDPPLQTLIPAFGRVMMNARLAVSSVNDVCMEWYFLVRSFRDPIAMQAINARQGLATAMIRVDRWATSLELRENLHAMNTLAREYAAWAKDYFVRLIHR